MATIRVTFPAPSGQPDPEALSPADAFNTAGRKFAEGIMAMEYVTGAHVAIAGKVDRLPVRKGSLQRQAGGITFDGVIMVEALGRPQLERVMGKIEELVASEKSCTGTYAVGVYDLAYYLAAECS